MDHAQSKCNGEKGVAALPELPETPFGDALPDPASEIATQVMNLTWARYGLTDPRSEVFDHDALCDRHGDVQTIANKVICAALASPRADSDERTADDAPWPEEYARLADGYGPVEEWRDWTKQAGRDPLSPGALHALRGMVGEFATPAQPAGTVPDSLRALDGTDEAVFACACARWVRSLLASHPAGQSAGSGAEVGGSVEVIERCVKLAKDAGLDSVTITGSVRHWQGIIAKLREPAPDSTRTGDEGTEEAVEKMAWIILANLRTDVSVADLRRKLDEEQSGKFGLGRSWCHALGTARRQARAILAARPAAPEAQGAWRERAATEIDAIARQWGTEGDADGRAYAKTLAAILRAEHPAPPASSGQ